MITLALEDLFKTLKFFKEVLKRIIIVENSLYTKIFIEKSNQIISFFYDKTWYFKIIL
jgi:hypothetical protein